jgi:hypothetical protein
MGGRNSFLIFVSDSRFCALDSQLRKQKNNYYFISTTAISSAQLQNFYVGIIETNGKTANVMSQLQFKCHNCNSNGITAKKIAKNVSCFLLAHTKKATCRRRPHTPPSHFFTSVIFHCLLAKLLRHSLLVLMYQLLRRVLIRSQGI